MPASRHGWVLLGMPLFLLVLWSVWQTYNPNRALVVYVYQPRAGDIEYTHNVQYFIREGVQVRWWLVVCICCASVHLQGIV